MLSLDASTTQSLLPFDSLVDALRRAFVDGCTVPLRHHHTVEVADGPPGTMLLMPSWQANAYLGIKTVAIFPGNKKLGLPGLHSTYLLNDAGTGEPLAIIDGNEITSRRTAAASALAASFLCRSDANSMLVIGAGRVASLLPYAYRVVRDIERVAVWDIDSAQAERLVSQLRADGFDARVAARIDHACETADVVSAATLSTEPLVLRDYLRPGTHLDLIGSFTPTMRETDNRCFDGTSVFVDTDEAAMKAGDLLYPMAAGVLGTGDIRSDLAGLCRGTHAGRRDRNEITVFKAVGTALEDLAAAVMAYEAYQRL